MSCSIRSIAMLCTLWESGRTDSSLDCSGSAVASAAAAFVAVAVKERVSLGVVAVDIVGLFCSQAIRHCLLQPCSSRCLCR